jgi:hypothetical protein
VSEHGEQWAGEAGRTPTGQSFAQYREDSFSYRGAGRRVVHPGKVDRKIKEKAKKKTNRERSVD